MRYKDVFEFGDAKLRVFDIDPLYLAMHRAKMSLALRQRFTFAFVAFDLAGLAADIASAPDYWAAMHEAVAQTKRGAPRRYFRGAAAHNALEKIYSKFRTAEAAIASLHGPYATVRLHMKAHFPQFGDCAAFKLCDMVERTCGNKIDFSQVDIFTVCNSAQVEKGAVKAAEVLGLTRPQLLTRMLNYKWATDAGPDFKRPLGPQEIETILCYYSHDDAHNKHFPGMDARGVYGELQQGQGALARKLMRCMPREGGLI